MAQALLRALEPPPGTSALEERGTHLRDVGDRLEEGERAGRTAPAGPDDHVDVVGEVDHLRLLGQSLHEIEHGPLALTAQAQERLVEQHRQRLAGRARVARGDDSREQQLLDVGCLEQRVRRRHLTERRLEHGDASLHGVAPVGQQVDVGDELGRHLVRLGGALAPPSQLFDVGLFDVQGGHR